MSGFVLLNLIKDLGLDLEDFHLCYTRVRSGKDPKYFLTPRKGWVCFTGIPSKDYDPKHYFLLSGNWKSPMVNTTLFSMRRDFNIGKTLLVLNLLSIPNFLILELVADFQNLTLQHLKILIFTIPRLPSLLRRG